MYHRFHRFLRRRRSHDRNILHRNQRNHRRARSRQTGRTKRGLFMHAVVAPFLDVLQGQYEITASDVESVAAKLPTASVSCRSHTHILLFDHLVSANHDRGHRRLSTTSVLSYIQRKTKFAACKSTCREQRARRSTSGIGQLCRHSVRICFFRCQVARAHLGRVRTARQDVDRWPGGLDH